MQSMAATRGKSRGGRKSTRGRNPGAAAGQLAQVSEGESSAAAGQQVLVSEEGTVRDGALVEVGEGEMEGNSSVARLQVVSFSTFGCKHFEVMLNTNHMIGPSRSSGQRIWPSAATGQDGGCRFANHFSTVPLQMLEKIAIAVAHLLPCPGGIFTRRLCPTGSFRQDGSISHRARKRAPAPNQPDQPTRGTSGANRRTSPCRRSSDAKPDQLAFLGLGSSRNKGSLHTSYWHTLLHLHCSSEAVVVPLVQEKTHSHTQQFVRAANLLRYQSRPRPPSAPRPRTDVLHLR